MPKKSTDDKINELLANTQAENAQLKRENDAFETLLRSTSKHYLGIQKGLLELSTSVQVAEEDVNKLIKILDERKAARKLLEEKGVQKGGTG